MSLKATELQTGDRVMLNCPKSARTHREAIFLGIHRSVEDAMNAEGLGALLMGPDTLRFLTDGGTAWASFQLQSAGGVQLDAAFVVEPDGSLRDEAGRRIFIERRMRMGRG